ncbi:hypothetical protein CON11_26670 [Priestia megaterium]|uniref:DUF7910 domain-containing protein n=1 Tax=Priestia megaterium TaxID=1404 RepID=UPI000BEB4BFC|nr:hypothetical protein [Priestia megaterium]PEC41739.1 hypothetical protein CON11_26670 [Priestia megaterium]
MVIPKIGESSRICIQTWMGTYVSVDTTLDKNGKLVVVNSSEAREWETFELQRLDEEYFTLKTHNGKYLSPQNGGGGLVYADGPEPGAWEKIRIFIDENGLIVIAATNGQYLSADNSGVIMANCITPKGWEGYQVVDSERANNQFTRIEVNVYKIMNVSPIWHTGTVIDGIEYYFDTNGEVKTTTPKGMNGNLSHHRTIVRFVPNNLETLKSVLNEVINRWNGTNYVLDSHNCNFFTDDLLHSLGTPGLDQEYLNASGLAKGLRSIPGAALYEELLVKWPVTDKRLDRAFMEDLKRLDNIPDNIREEIESVFHVHLPKKILPFVDPTHTLEDTARRVLHLPR